MANYLLIYSGGSGMPRTDAERAAILQAWEKWFNQVGSAVVDQGNPTLPNGKTIASSGTVRAAAQATAPSGYSIIKADSLDAAVKLAQSNPVLATGGEVSVYETFAAM